MTCIIGSIENDRIVIGADSAAVDTDTLSMFSSKREKVFKISNEWGDEALIGFTDSFRMADIIQYNFELPRVDGLEMMRYMVRHFVEDLREAFKEAGYAKVESSQEEGGTFMVGMYGRLFVIYEDFQVNECDSNFVSIGCGEHLGFGAMYALKDSEMETEEKIQIALEAAEKFSGGVSGPFVIKTL